MRRILLLAVFSCFLFSSYGQIARNYTAADILHQMKKLNVLGSVLYIAAHPDDENTRLISYLANDKMYRTGYLSLTRGDGGQNLIGNEQGIELGLIRTQELLAARRIDGGEQFFSRAYDFGFSKSPEETFKFWHKEDILSDVVWVIRKFQPDVIIARFPEDARAGHGHHSASGILARLGYEAAANAELYSEQISKGAQVWQAKRLLWNTFNFGSSNTIDTTQFNIDVGNYLPLLGKSVGELAGESRSQHKSQGFGVSRQRGTSKEFFTLVGGSAPTKELLDGVNTTWSRMPGAEGVDSMINGIIGHYHPSNPSASIPALKQLLNRLYLVHPMNNWVRLKIADTKNLMLACAGVYAEAVVSSPAIIPGDTVKLKLNIINRTGAAGHLFSVDTDNSTKAINKPLPFNQPLQMEWPLVFRNGLLETQPYWLRQSQANGMFTVTDQELVGLAENKPLSVTFRINIDSMFIAIDQPIQYRSVDPVKGEQYQPVYISDQFLMYSDPSVLLFRKDQKDSALISVNVSAVKKSAAANPQFQLSSDSTQFKTTIEKPAMQWNAGDKQSLQLKLPNYLRATGKETDQMSMAFLPGGAFGAASFSNTGRSIEYDHIPTQTWHYLDKIKVLHIDLKTAGKKIGYIAGAGDKVPEALRAMGYEVKLLQPDDVVAAKLMQYDAIMSGVRAYNVNEWLSDKYEELMHYVQAGGNLIVQYNTNNNLGPVKAKLSPYALSIGRTRVTDEKSPVKFLLPQHPALNFPNKIGGKDFEGWVQERSVYQAESFDATKFQAPLAMADAGEAEQNGSLLIAAYGKGNFVYTGLAFFRQLPAGVPGAYRLLANLIAL